MENVPVLFRRGWNFLGKEVRCIALLDGMLFYTEHREEGESMGMKDVGDDDVVDDLLTLNHYVLHTHRARNFCLAEYHILDPSPSSSSIALNAVLDVFYHP
jgi:hypothetical protein